MNKAQLAIGEITFGKWKNKDKNDVFKRVYSSKDIVSIPDESTRKMLFEDAIKEWLVAYSVFRGEGPLKAPTIETTYNNIQELDVVEANKLGDAFSEFFSSEINILKKK